MAEYRTKQSLVLTDEDLAAANVVMQGTGLNLHTVLKSCLRFGLETFQAKPIDLIHFRVEKELAKAPLAKARTKKARKK